jgi:glucokinase
VILACDIGGTNARVALFERGRRDPILAEQARTEAWSGADDLLHDFLGRHRVEVTSACVAIAGTVIDGRSRSVNLPWTIDEYRLGADLGIPALTLFNDLEANARAVPLLDPAELAPISAGDPAAAGTRVVVSAGTGLGEAALFWDGSGYHAIAGEGGHADFAPRSELEVELYRYLTADYGHVSYERICSGSGLVNIDRFLRAGRSRRDDWCLEPRSTPPSPAAIAAQADVDPTSIAAQALTMFVSIYGARAGTVALSFMATGGVYLGGGIAPRLLDRLRDGAFMRALTEKGRLSSLVSGFPVHVIRNDRAALLGAAAIAAERDLPAGRGKVVSLR